MTVEGENYRPKPFLISFLELSQEEDLFMEKIPSEDQNKIRLTKQKPKFGITGRAIVSDKTVTDSVDWVLNGPSPKEQDFERMYRVGRSLMDLQDLLKPPEESSPND